MESLAQWLPIILGVVANVVAVVWSFASLKEKIAVIDTKLEGVSEQVAEIKGNHLSHLQEDIKDLSEKLTNHLINPNH